MVLVGKDAESSLRRGNSDSHESSEVQVDVSTLTNGDFNCSNCGRLISPDDWTEDAYIIEGSENLEKSDETSWLLLRCRCGLRIRIVGFGKKVGVSVS